MTPDPAPRFAILASGSGSNAEALMAAFQRGTLPATLTRVLTDNPQAEVIERARRRAVPLTIVPRAGLSRADHEASLLRALRDASVQHLLLAGYMRLLSAAFLTRFGGHVLNIHPSLLPEFPGLHAVERQWQAGVRVAGATVHLVDAGVDTGPVLLSGSLLVRGDEGAAGLAARIKTEIEHALYPRAVLLFCERLARGTLPALTATATPAPAP